jgi:hypothetical protein
MGLTRLLYAFSFAVDAIFKFLLRKPILWFALLHVLLICLLYARSDVNHPRTECPITGHCRSQNTWGLWKVRCPRLNISRRERKVLNCMQSSTPSPLAEQFADDVCLFWDKDPIQSWHIPLWVLLGFYMHFPLLLMQYLSSFWGSLFCDI